MTRPAALNLNTVDGRIVAAVQDGLATASRPFALIAKHAGVTEATVIERLQALIASGAIKRFALVVHHRELGYTANAMVVFDVPDDTISQTGRLVASYPFVTLCYRRPRRPPRWTFNLFCMIHGRDRNTVLEQIETLAQLPELEDSTHEVLFSVRRFKQRGARYVARECPGSAG